MDKFWKIFFIAIVAVWAIIVGSTLFYFITGYELLLDTDIDLYYITLPFLILILSYLFLSIFIFLVYLFVDGKVKLMQKRSLETNDKSRQYGMCSIVIASRNEDNVIKKTVLECLKQTYSNFEVIVVCHNCTDNTFHEANVNDVRVRVFDYKTKEVGKGIALNYGLEKSIGDYILILDADGTLNHEFIELAMPLLQKYAAVQGRYIPSNRNYSITSQLLSIEGDLWSTPYMTARTFMDKRAGLGGTGYIIKKDILLQVGGFTNHLVDDYELSSRLLKAKHRIVFAPYCINYDEKPPSLDIMLRQRARWARGFISLLKYRIFEPSDLLGLIFWLSPIGVFVGLAMLLLIGYGAIFNIITGYFPFTYASITIEQWLILLGTIWAIQALVLVKQYGAKGLKYIAYIPIYTPFVLYVMVAFVRAFSIKSWDSTKTKHGFIKPS